MVPDKFNMVDMEGIDIITSQGETVEGLYQKLVESIAQCRYQCLYNWKFDGILIPPTYVEMDIVDDVVWINEGVSVDEEDVVRVYSLEPPAPDPRLLALAVSANGDYLPPADYDGFSSVNVAVPDPVFALLQATANGTYYPQQGVDGFLAVEVAVPTQQPVLNTLSVTENGTYNPPTGVDGFSSVNVNVPSGSVPAVQFHLGRLSINSGVIDESSEYCYSDLIPISTGNGQWFLDLARSDMNSYYIGICLYESDGETRTGYFRQSSSYRSYSSAAMPSARYFRIANKVSNMPFSFVGFITDNIYIAGTQSTLMKSNL